MSKVLPDLLRQQVERHHTEDIELLGAASEIEKLSHENDRLKKLIKEAYESLLGDTHDSAWHSQACYVGGSNRDQNLCTCGLTKALYLLRHS